MIHTNHASYMEDLANYKSTPFKIVNGKGFVFIDGKWRPENILPLPRFEPAYKENPDGTKISGGTLPSKKRKK